MDNLVIIGCSTTGEHAFRFVTKYSLYNIKGFAVHKKYIDSNTFMGKPVFAIEDLQSIINKEKDFLFVALLWNKLNADRKDLYLALKAEGYRFANLVSPTSIIDGKIGENCWIHDFVSIWHNSTIGNNVVIRPNVVVCEDCIIGDHCFVGVKATVGGKSKIGPQTFLGINAVIFDTRTVGKKCIIGACTFVNRDLPDFTICKVESSSQVIKKLDDDLIESKLLASGNCH